MASQHCGHKGLSVHTFQQGSECGLTQCNIAEAAMVINRVLQILMLLTVSHFSFPCCLLLMFLPVLGSKTTSVCMPPDTVGLVVQAGEQWGSHNAPNGRTLIPSLARSRGNRTGVGRCWAPQRHSCTQLQSRSSDLHSVAPFGPSLCPRMADFCCSQQGETQLFQTQYINYLSGATVITNSEFCAESFN